LGNGTVRTFVEYSYSKPISIGVEISETTFIDLSVTNIVIGKKILQMKFVLILLLLGIKLEKVGI